MPSVGNNQLRILIIPQLRGLNADLAAGVLVRMAKLTADAVTLECWIFLLRLFRRGSEKKKYISNIYFCRRYVSLWVPFNVGRGDHDRTGVFYSRKGPRGPHGEGTRCAPRGLQRLLWLDSAGYVGPTEWPCEREVPREPKAWRLVRHNARLQSLPILCQ